jgi:elongation factor G
MKALHFDGNNGEVVRKRIAALEGEAREAKRFWTPPRCFPTARGGPDGRETAEQVRAAVRAGTLSLKLTPVFIGSAYKKRAIQPLLDAVVYYLASPADHAHRALDLDAGGAEVLLPPTGRTACFVASCSRG